MIQLCKYILVVVTLFSLSSLSAQSTSKTHSLKAYANFAYSNESKNEMLFKENMVRSFESRYDLGYFSPAFTLYNEKGSFHELEISRIKFGSESYYLNEKPDPMDNPYFIPSKILSKTTNISFRYEFAYKIKAFDEASRFNLYIGMSGNPYYLKEKFAYGRSDFSPESQSQIGLAIGAVPRITYNITPNWFLDLNIPVSVVDFAFIRFKTDNPTRSLEYRKLNTTELALFPNNLLLRFGVGLRI